APADRAVALVVIATHFQKETEMKRLLAGLAIAASIVGGAARAADHRDGPGTLTDATVDITDVYAWNSADASKVYLVMDLQGANTGAVAGMTKFSNTALYAFHL